MLPEEIPITGCHQDHIFYAPPKRVRELISIFPCDSTDETLVGAVTAILTNPLWVVKVRMFTTNAETPTAYRNLWRMSDRFHLKPISFNEFYFILFIDGLTEIYRTEGLAGWYRGTSLALVGVSNGALQFMGYEEMKRWAFERKRRQFTKEGREWTTSEDKLVSIS